jgi:DNA-binding NtrC family response regulator
MRATGPALPPTAADPNERLLLIGSRQHVLEVAFDVARKNAATLSVREFDQDMLAALSAGDCDLLGIELDVGRTRSGVSTEGSSERRMPAIDTLVGRNLADVEQALILSTLTHCNGNRTSAASMLGISVRTMRNKLRAFLDDGVAVMPAPLTTGGSSASRSN